MERDIGALEQGMTSTEGARLVPDAKLVPGRIYVARVCMEARMGTEISSRDRRRNIESGGKKGPGRPCILMSVVHSVCTMYHLCPLTTFKNKPIDEVWFDSDKLVSKEEFYKTFVPVAPLLSLIPDNPLYEPINIHPELQRASYVSLVELAVETEFIVPKFKENHVVTVEQEDFKRLKKLVKGLREEVDSIYSLKRDDNSQGEGGGVGAGSTKDGGEGQGRGGESGDHEDEDGDIDWDWEPGVGSPFLGSYIELTEENLEDIDWSWDGYEPWLSFDVEGCSSLLETTPILSLK